MAGALFGGTGVLCGAFGAHALSDVLDARALSAWDTAVLYQLVHALALILTAALISNGESNRALSVAGFGFLTGILLFSGSLYVLALDGPRLLGPVTPIGGVSFMVGWAALAIHAIRQPSL
jgi:uncharacterized membrane protein YgdD (TMEM256/DUF423 family)